MQKIFTSSLIPYFFKDNDLYVFLLRRSSDAPRYPNGLGAFGGGIEENENEEEAMIRELKEELEYTPKDYKKFDTFETDNYIASIYIEQVKEGFENELKVNEGTRGEWHKAKEVVERNDLVPNTQKAVRKMLGKLI